MGIMPCWLQSENIPHDEIVPPNPNPNKFSIIKVEKIDSYWIAEIRYSGCTTFGGHKLLLMNKDPNSCWTIDPHLLSEDHCVIARFRPNKMGWKLARICAMVIVSNRQNKE